MSNEYKGTGIMLAPIGDVWEDLRNMHAKFGFNSINGTQLKHRLDCLMEELNEAYAAVSEPDFFKAQQDFIDAHIDLIVFAVGTLHLCIGTELSQSAWNEVMRANFAKEVGFNEKRPNSQGVDLIKPEGWTPPDHSNFLTETLAMALGEASQLASNEEPVKPRYAANVLTEAADLLNKKSQDYAFAGSTVKPADYYPRGVDSFIEMIDTHKRLRQTSILDKMRNGEKVHFEGLRDTLIDRINYLALMIEWIDGQCPGQDPSRDIFNNEILDDPDEFLLEVDLNEH